MRKQLLQSDSGGNQTRKISIVLVEDHPLMRKALNDILKTQEDFEVIGEVTNGSEAIEMVTERMPDVVIIGIGKSKQNALEAMREIHHKFPDVAILVLTVYDVEQILGIFESGASGCLTKGVFDDELIQAVHGVVAGETIFSSSISQGLLKYALKHRIKEIPMKRGEKLTIRELEILRLVAKGMHNRDIALRLGLSNYTVRNYLANIFAKLHVNSRGRAIIKGVRNGFLTAEDLE